MASQVSQISVSLRVTTKSLKWKLREEKLLKDFQQSIECTGQRCRKKHFRTKERDVREGMNSPVKKKNGSLDETVQERGRSGDGRLFGWKCLAPCTH